MITITTINKNYNNNKQRRWKFPQLFTLLPAVYVEDSNGVNENGNEVKFWRQQTQGLNGIYNYQNSILNIMRVRGLIICKNIHITPLNEALYSISDTEYNFWKWHLICKSSSFHELKSFRWTNVMFYWFCALKSEEKIVIKMK